METHKDFLANDWKVDDEVRNYMYQTSVLAKFIAVVGMLFTAVTTIKSLYGFIKLIIIYGERFLTAGFIGSIVGVLLAGTVYFAISIFTYRFAEKLQQALKTADQECFQLAWNNFKMAFRIMGIVFIVFLLLILIIIIF